ncbi:MAG: hypothetical protein MUO62_17345 [Anaerolineales bacterium]|nr:hypothetical protein [Anaerolineales bacterium]
MAVLTNVTGVSTPLFHRPMKPKSNGRELSRLITAAVVNQGFCQMLLDNPKRALASGYKGETFALGSEEQDLILSIRAGSLAEFAAKLADHKNRSNQNNGNSHWGRM